MAFRRALLAVAGGAALREDLGGVLGRRGHGGEKHGGEERGECDDGEAAGVHDVSSVTLRF